MFVIHRIVMTLRRVFICCYYHLIYGKKFKYGKKFRMRGCFRLFIEKKGSIVFGDNCFINNCFSATSINMIKIGNDCLFGENVKIYDHNHNYKEKDNGTLIREQGFRSNQVVIGNNCWIASNVTILSGVHIGDNCVIGANCLIYKDIATGSVIKCKEEFV